MDFVTVEYGGADRLPAGRRFAGTGNNQLITNCTFKESALAGIAIFTVDPRCRTATFRPARKWALFDNATATLDTPISTPPCTASGSGQRQQLHVYQLHH